MTLPEQYYRASIYIGKTEVAPRFENVNYYGATRKESLNPVPLEAPLFPRFSSSRVGVLRIGLKDVIDAALAEREYFSFMLRIDTKLELISRKRRKGEGMEKAPPAVLSTFTQEGIGDIGGRQLFGHKKFHEILRLELSDASGTPFLFREDEFGDPKNILEMVDTLKIPIADRMSLAGVVGDLNGALSEGLITKYLPTKDRARVIRETDMVLQGIIEEINMESGLLTIDSIPVELRNRVTLQQIFKDESVCPVLTPTVDVFVAGQSAALDREGNILPRPRIVDVVLASLERAVIEAKR